MSDAVPSWKQLREAEDAAVLTRAHNALCATARRLMPHLDADTARRMRVAMLGGFRHLQELDQLVAANWKDA